MTGCAGTAADQTVAPRTPDSLSEAYTSKLTQNGYSLQLNEYWTGEGITTYDILSSTLGKETWIMVKIINKEEIVTQVELTMGHPENLLSDIEAFAGLMQMMVQVCDSSFEKDERGAQNLVRTIFERESSGELMQAHGITYWVEGSDYAPLQFQIFYPGNYYKSSETAEALQGQKAFDFSAQALLDELGSRLEQEQFSLKRIETGTAGIAELAMRPTDGSPEVYSIVHALGITVGWLMLYTTEAGLVQIDLVDRDDGDRLRYLVMRELREQLVLSCDPVLRQDNSDVIDKKIDEIAYYIRLNTPIVENGIQYIESSDGASYPLTMTVAD